MAGILPGVLEWHVSLHLHLVMTNQGPATGANCFAAPYLPLQAALERWFPVPGAAAHHLGSLYHRTGVVRASAAHCMGDGIMCPASAPFTT